MFDLSKDIGEREDLAADFAAGFAAFFGALFYVRVLAVPWLGGEGNNFFTNLFLWEGFENTWPTTAIPALEYFVRCSGG